MPANSSTGLDGESVTAACTVAKSTPAVRPGIPEVKP